MSGEYVGAPSSRLLLDYQQRYRLLQRVYRIALLSAAACVVITFFLFEWPTRLAVATACLALFVGDRLVDRGAQNSAAWVLLITMALVVLGLPVLGEASNDSALFFIAPTMVFARLFVSQRAFWWLAVIFASEVTALTVMENSGWIASTFGRQGSPILWSEWAMILLAHFCCCFLVDAILIGVDRSSLSDDERRAENRAAWHHAAQIDALTGLFTTAGFLPHAERLFRRAIIDSEPVALFAIDVDYLKALNDSFSARVGDWILQEIAAQLRASFRAGDLPARVGDDHFMILLPGVNAAAAQSSAERLRQQLARNAVTIDNVRVPFTVSIGVACSQHAIEFSAFMQLADTALARAKQQGRNTVSVLHAESLFAES